MPGGDAGFGFWVGWDRATRKRRCGWRGRIRWPGLGLCGRASGCSSGCSGAQYQGARLGHHAEFARALRPNCAARAHFGVSGTPDRGARLSAGLGTPRLATSSAAPPATRAAGARRRPRGTARGRAGGGRGEAGSGWGFGPRRAQVPPPGAQERGAWPGRRGGTAPSQRPGEVERKVLRREGGRERALGIGAYPELQLSLGRGAEPETIRYTPLAGGKVVGTFSSKLDLAASGNDSGAPTAPALGGESEPHGPSPDVLMDSTDKELKAEAAAVPASSIRTAPGPRQSEAMDTVGGLGSLLPRPCRVLVLLNPWGGKGKALQLFQNCVQPLLAEAEVYFTLKLTERQNHARELVCAEELDRWDALVIMSGDGLIHEVVNGLMERPDWKTAIQKPLCSLPGGTGNALAASLNYYAGYEQVTSEDLLTNCTLLLCRRHLSPMNLLSLHMASGLHIYSVLSLTWGFIADVDLESEKYRRLGEMRFTLGACLRLAALRIYQGQLAYLPVGSTVSQTTASSPWLQQGPVDTHLVPLEEPVPSHWTVVPDQDFVLVLVLLHTHLTSDIFIAPMGRCAAGVMHLFYVRAGVSRAMLLRLLLAMHKGKHMEYNCPYLVHVPVVAFRLEPKSQRGVFAVDGERMTCEAVQGQVHPDYYWMVSGSRNPPAS